MLEVIRTQIGVITYLMPTGPFAGDEELHLLDKMVETCADERFVNLVIDLTKVPVLDSKTLESFLDVQDKLARLGGSFKVVNANTLIKDIFHITGVGDYIAVIEAN